MKPTSSFETWIEHGNEPRDLEDAVCLSLALMGAGGGRYSSIALPRPCLHLVTGPSKPNLYVHTESIPKFLEALLEYMGLEPGSSIEAARQFEKDMAE